MKLPNKTYHQILSKDKSVEVRSALARFKELPLDIVIALASDKKEQVRESVAERSDLPESIIENLYNDSSENVIAAIAGSHLLSYSQFSELAKSTSFRIRRAVASNPHINQSVIDQLIEDDYTTEYLMYNPIVPSAIRDKLAAKIASGKYSHQIEELAYKYNFIPDSILQFLITHEDDSIRRTLARNPSLDDASLYILAKDGNVDIRKAVAERNGLSKSLCETLVKDSEEVLYILAMNESLQDDSVLLILLNRNDLPNVQAQAARNPATQLLKCPEIIKSSVEYLLCHLAMNPSLPQEWISKLLNKGDKVQRAIGRNSSIPNSVLESLSVHKNSRVRQTVASNPSVSLDVLEKLSIDEDDGVRWLVACNSESSSAILEKLTNDEYWLVREAVAANKNASNSSRDILSKDKNKDIRIILANPIKFKFPTFVDDPMIYLST